VNKGQLRAAAQATFGDAMVEKKAVLDACKVELPPPRDIYGMAEEIGEFGLAPDHVVVDVGGGRGDWSRRISDRYGCACVTIDLSPSRLRESRGKGNVALLADAEELPFPSRSIDAVWCRDMLEMVEDPAAVLSEYKRVLRPGGGLMLYVPLFTEALEPLEQAEMMMLDAPAWWADGRAVVEDAIRAAGFEVVRTDVTSPEYTEGLLLRDPEAVIAQMIEHAQIRRGRQEMERALGPDWYARFEAWSRWQMYLLLGKIENRLWLLRKR
jgi:SAM-dependent methyltransferase